MAFSAHDIGAFLAHGFDALIDVRSPAEYAEDHVPGAISLPVLSDAERAEVGTIYKQVSPFRARKIGAAMVARNAASHIEGPLAGHEGGWRPLVYCWRGGQRSGSFASILTQVGWRADVVAGGYQSWRRLVVAALYDTPFPAPVTVLDGNTGTAKTRVLAGLAARGVQVIDLEGLAQHRGSLFGAVAHAQPGQKAFETALGVAIAGLDPARPVVIEAESNKIGDRSLPPSLWAAMTAAPRIEIAAPLPARAEFLCSAYADVIGDAAALEARIVALKPMQGRERVGDWLALARTGEMRRLAAELMEHHYDPRYANSRARQGGAGKRQVQAERLDGAGIEGLADRIAAMVSAK